MLFNSFGNPTHKTLMLIHGLGVLYQVFDTLIGHLQTRYHIIAVQVDGFLIDDENKAIPSAFTSIDDQVDQLVEYIRTTYDGHLDAAYGLSMGGCIVAKLQERTDVTIDHVILDAAPLVPLPRWSIDSHCHITCFPHMQHGQLVIDHSDRVAQLLTEIIG